MGQNTALELPDIISTNYNAVISDATHSILNDTYSNEYIVTTQPWTSKDLWIETEEQRKFEEAVRAISPKKVKENESMRRLVRVIVIDPDENLPVEHSVLYMGEEEVTDLTDEELFYELELKSLLTTHNSLRQGVINKKASKNKDKDVYLDDVRIKDLKMVVLTLADF